MKAMTYISYGFMVIFICLCAYFYHIHEVQRAELRGYAQGIQVRVARDSSQIRERMMSKKKRSQIVDTTRSPRP